MDGLWAGVISGAILGVLALMGKRMETGTSRAVEAQGAAADEWQELAGFHRERAEAAEQVLRDEREARRLEQLAHEREVAGLEQRLEEVGLPIRRRPRVPGEPVRQREPS